MPNINLFSISSNRVYALWIHQWSVVVCCRLDGVQFVIQTIEEPFTSNEWGFVAVVWWSRGLLGNCCSTVYCSHVGEQKNIEIADNNVTIFDLWSNEQILINSHCNSYDYLFLLMELIIVLLLSIGQLNNEYFINCDTVCLAQASREASPAPTRHLNRPQTQLIVNMTLLSSFQGITYNYIDYSLTTSHLMALINFSNVHQPLHYHSP